MSVVALLILVLLLFGALPTWHSYGYGPSGVVGVLLVVLLVLLLLGRI